jgi:hypothetical protein
MKGGGRWQIGRRLLLTLGLEGGAAAGVHKAPHTYWHVNLIHLATAVVLLYRPRLQQQRPPLPIAHTLTYICARLSSSVSTGTRPGT